MTAFAESESILVTGGAGFIGSHVVERILARGARRITVLDNFDDFYPIRLKRANITTFAPHPGVTIVEGDILDGPMMDDLFAKSGFTTVIHLAARAGVRPSLEAPLLYQRVNVDGTYRLLELSRLHGIKKFVFASSSSVYGVRTVAPFKETEPVLAPASVYAATKIAGEAACHAYSNAFGLPCVCLRFFTVYGPRQRPDLAIRKFTELISAGRPVPMYGDGTTARDYTYIDDIVVGVLEATAYDATPFEIINLGNERPVLLRDLIASIGDALGTTPRIERLPDQPGDVPLTCADPSKARDLLGFEASVPFDEGIRRTVKALVATRFAV